MKKNKFLISLLVILVLSSVICVTAVATLDTPNVVKAIYKVDRDTPATKEIELPEESEVKDSNISKFNDIEIQYKESVVYTEDKVRDIYTDEKNNEFTYDGSGNLVGYELNREEADTKTAVSDGNLTEEQVKDIAYKAAVTMYGDIMKEFQFDYIKKTDCFHVMYVKKYGFVKAAYCLVKIISDGTVDSCRLSNYNEFSDFDDKLLENVTKDILVDYVKKQVKSEHPDYQSFKITSFALYKINGKYHIDMLTEISVSEPEPSVIGKDYLYALE